MARVRSEGDISHQARAPASARAAASARWKSVGASGIRVAGSLAIAGSSHGLVIVLKASFPAPAISKFTDMRWARSSRTLLGFRSDDARAALCSCDWPLATGTTWRCACAVLQGSGDAGDQRSTSVWASPDQAPAILVFSRGKIYFCATHGGPPGLRPGFLCDCIDIP
jgi:hypothetical protein